MSIKLTPPDDAFEHLHPEIRHSALADLAKREELIKRDRWVSYPAGDSAIARLFELADMPPRMRMPSILFWAKPNMGKTHIQYYFMELHKQRAEAHPGTYGNVFRLELNGNLTEKRFYLDMLAKLDAPTPEATVYRLQAMVMRQLEARGIRLMILDELQRVTELRLTEQRHILNALKYLSNRLSISIAGFGSGEARVLIESDLHLAERFDIVALPPWTKAQRWAIDAVKERLAWMPLRKATTVDLDFMAALFRHSDELLGRMFSLLERAAVAALEHDECLSVALLDQVAGRRRSDND
jgi:hypothetical protein